MKMAKAYASRELSINSLTTEHESVRIWVEPIDQTGKAVIGISKS